MSNVTVSSLPQSLPPSMVLFQIATGFYYSRALSLIAQLGIADLLIDGPRPAAALAAATHTNPDALRRVLRLLVSSGVFDEADNGDFALTPLSEALRSDAVGSVRTAVQMFGGRVQDSWADLQYCIETGEPAFRKRGESDAFESMRKHPQEAAVFDAAMADFTRMVAVAVAAAYDFSPYQTLVDVGGGNGALMIGILNANPHLRAVVFDQPAVVERARASIAEAGLSERCQVVGGDFFATPPAGGDAYVLKHVIHDWDDARATAILRGCHRVMAPHAKLLIVEGTYPAHVDQSLVSRGAASNDVNMLVCTGGRQRSEAEFRALFEASGFALSRIVPTAARASVIEGARA